MKNVSLIATAPAMLNSEQLSNIIGHDLISGIRWNTGVVTPYSPYNTLEILRTFADRYHKKFWVDIKGRQLRVTSWADPFYDAITVNHSIELREDVKSLKILLRGEEPLNVVNILGNQVYVDPLPKNAVGAGQSVNILGDGVRVIGYLTESDKKYLMASRQLSIFDIMASFAQSVDDINEIKKICNKFRVVSKIESKDGVSNVVYLSDAGDLMAARDDLYIQLDFNPYRMLGALKSIINADTNAICASRIFSSLEKSATVSLQDFEDLESMYAMGYRRFMLSDEICHYKFNEAMRAWNLFISN